MNSWDDRKFRGGGGEDRAQRRSWWRGLWTETCVALPTIQAIHDNYEVLMLVEELLPATSASSPTTTRWKRIVQAGARPVTSAFGDAGVAARLGPSTTPTMPSWDIVKTPLRRVRASGVEYAYTMVHKAPPDTIPRTMPSRLLAEAAE